MTRATNYKIDSAISRARIFENIHSYLVSSNQFLTMISNLGQLTNFIESSFMLRLSNKMHSYEVNQIRVTNSNFHHSVNLDQFFVAKRYNDGSVFRSVYLENEQVEKSKSYIRYRVGGPG